MSETSFYVPEEQDAKRKRHSHYTITEQQSEFDN
jgi:hypothetical protein